MDNELPAPFNWTLSYDHNGKRIVLVPESVVYFARVLRSKRFKRPEIAAIFGVSSEVVHEWLVALHPQCPPKECGRILLSSLSAIVVRNPKTKLPQQLHVTDVRKVIKCDIHPTGTLAIPEKNKGSHDFKKPRKAPTYAR